MDYAVFYRVTDSGEISDHVTAPMLQVAQFHALLDRRPASLSGCTQGLWGQRHADCRRSVKRLLKLRRITCPVCGASPSVEHVLTEALSEFGLHYLGHRILRQFVHDNNVAWALVISEVLPAELVDPFGADIIFATEPRLGHDDR